MKLEVNYPSELLNALDSPVIIKDGPVRGNDVVTGPDCGYQELQT